MNEMRKENEVTNDEKWNWMMMNWARGACRLAWLMRRHMCRVELLLEAARRAAADRPRYKVKGHVGFAPRRLANTGAVGSFQGPCVLLLPEAVWRCGGDSAGDLAQQAH